MFTLIHVLISILGIASGFVVIGGMLGGNARPAATCLFLAATIATSVTGFFFPFTGITPAFIFGVLSLIVLALALFSLSAKKLQGGWRKTYIITALTAQFLNTFVLIAQLFQKVPALKTLAPTQSEPPFGIAQTLLLAAFIWIGIKAVKRTATTPP
jgi:phosphoglycerol transferase MdoB-like AlkP superfamily enzyme